MKEGSGLLHNRIYGSKSRKKRGYNVGKSIYEYFGRYMRESSRTLY